jgi:hypothetical protein
MQTDLRPRARAVLQDMPHFRTTVALATMAIWWI